MLGIYGFALDNDSVFGGKDVHPVVVTQFKSHIRFFGEMISIIADTTVLSANMGESIFIKTRNFACLPKIVGQNASENSRHVIFMKCGETESTSSSYDFKSPLNRKVDHHKNRVTICGMR